MSARNRIPRQSRRYGIVRPANEAPCFTCHVDTIRRGRKSKIVSFRRPVQRSSLWRKGEYGNMKSASLAELPCWHMSCFIRLLVPSYAILQRLEHLSPCCCVTRDQAAIVANHAAPATFLECSAFLSVSGTGPTTSPQIYALFAM